MLFIFFSRAEKLSNGDLEEAHFTISAVGLMECLSQHRRTLHRQAVSAATAKCLFDYSVVSQSSAWNIKNMALPG